MASPEVPSEDWHQYVVKNNSCVCNACGTHADLSWAWGELGQVGATDAGVVFANRAVEQLKADGWKLISDKPYCPGCAEKLGG